MVQGAKRAMQGALARHHDSDMITKKRAKTHLSTSPLLLSDSGRWRWRLPLLLFFALQRVYISYRYSCAVACRCRIAMVTFLLRTLMLSGIQGV